MDKSPRGFYEENLHKLVIIIKELRAKSRATALLRLLCGILIVACLVYLLKTGDSFWGAGLGLGVVLFVLLVRRSSVLNKQTAFQEALHRINTNEIQGLEGVYDSFDGGDDLMDSTHPYAYDLDLFGDQSLFQRVNRTITLLGRQFLSGILATPELEIETILSRQQAALELQTVPNWRQEFLATGMQDKEQPGDQAAIEDWLILPPVLSKSRYWPFVLWILPALTVTLWIIYLFLPLQLPAAFPIIFSLIQLGITANRAGFINERHHRISKRSDTLKKYYSLVSLIKQSSFSSSKLKQLQQKLDDSRYPASSFQHLISLLNALDNRLNLLMALILNGLLLWDLNCLIRIEKWNVQFKELFPAWMEVIGEADALISLAGYNFNHPEFVVPEILDEKLRGGFYMEMQAAGHPLLYPGPCIENDLLQSGTLNLFLITGANMAGKSTFLRTVGLNMILAMAGTSVYAKGFSLTPVQLFTSMRTHDSLQKHTSFFYAELKRLQWIMEKIKAKAPVYIFLDEILKGTNSRDQHLGSTELIKNIIHHDGRGLIATHDIELTNLAAQFPGRIKNIAFEIEMEGDLMRFSYQYKEGVCQNMNASILMKQMGIT
ncbi:MAG TPA: hypothetical protein VL053_05225 [Arachidicoccus sp.]|nr:hypothetical protein [Arachidicoccus sp.]